MKYDITYSCGHKGTIEATGNRKEKESKIEWAEKYGLCPECYKAKIIKKEQKMNLVLCVDVSHSMLHSSAYYDQKDVIISHFEGATYTHKDAINALGYHWVSYKKVWELTCSIKRFIEILKEVKAMGGTLKAERPQSLLASIKNQIVYDCHTGADTLGYKISKRPARPEGISADEWYELVKDNDTECYNVFVDILGIAPELQKMADDKYHGKFTKHDAPFKFL